MPDRLLEKTKHVLEFERVGYTMRQKGTISVEPTWDLREMIWRLESYVLRDHIADDVYTDTVVSTWPATTWQMFKYTHMLSWWLSWFVVRWPVRFIEDRNEMSVHVKRYLRYPEANLNIQGLGKPYIFELTEKEGP